MVNMASNGSTATFTSRDSMSSSLLSSYSTSSSTSSSRNPSSQISKVYRQASTLFLTRRLPEALSTLLPVITPPEGDHDVNGNSASKEPAPVACASRTTRVKVWSLYLTILNAILELDPEEGKQAFGTQEWRALVAKVRDGEVWEEIVRNGYGGAEGDVDSDVVINLATLLLAHARTQTLNQQRLENYLAASSRPNLDISDRLAAPHSRNSQRRPSPSKSSGTDTPRDLNSRVKILELYTLHVLLRNNEWEYAREFIGISEVLDEERREAFLQALQSLKEEQVTADIQEREERRRHEEQLQKDIEEARRLRLENEKRERRRAEEDRNSSKKASSEVDYGIESSNPNGSVNGSARARSSKDNTRAPRNGPRFSHAQRPSVSGSKAVAPPNFLRRAKIVMTNLQRLLESMAISFKTNPLILLRMLVFIMALVLALSRKDIRDRLNRALKDAWNKVKATAGMGVKVSYI